MKTTRNDWNGPDLRLAIVFIFQHGFYGPSIPDNFFFLVLYDGLTQMLPVETNYYFDNIR